MRSAASRRIGIQQYNSYAARRVGACLRCGVHIERDGGCQCVVCARYGCTFEFRAFQSTDEAADAAVDGIAPESSTTEKNGEGLLPEISIFFMTWGTDFSSGPLAELIRVLNDGEIESGHLIFLPFILFGVPAFVGAVASYARFLAMDIHPHFGNVEEIPLIRGASLMAMSAEFAFLAVLLQLSFLSRAGPLAVVYLAPFVVFATGLFAFTVLHFSVVIVRLLVAHRRGWQEINEDEQPYVEAGQLEELPLPRANVT